MGICPTSSKVRVTASFGDGSVKNIETPGNVSIATAKNDPNKPRLKCFRFFDSRGQYQLFASGYLASYTTTTGGIDQEQWPGSTVRKVPTVDNSMVLGGAWWYGNGYEQIEESPNQTGTAQNTASTSCNFSKPLVANCSIIIFDSNGAILYQADGVCPVNYEASCDDDCHEGCCKLATQSYPGYCCAKLP